MLVCWWRASQHSQLWPDFVNAFLLNLKTGIYTQLGFQLFKLNGSSGRVFSCGSPLPFHCGSCGWTLCPPGRWSHPQAGGCHIWWRLLEPCWCYPQSPFSPWFQHAGIFWWHLGPKGLCKQWRRKCYCSSLFFSEHTCYGESLFPAVVTSNSKHCKQLSPTALNKLLDNHSFLENELRTTCSAQNSRKPK